jgi:hypothetical protein
MVLNNYGTLTLSQYSFYGRRKRPRKKTRYVNIKPESTYVYIGLNREQKVQNNPKTINRLF